MPSPAVRAPRPDAQYSVRMSISGANHLASRLLSLARSEIFMRGAPDYGAVERRRHIRWIKGWSAPHPRESGRPWRRLRMLLGAPNHPGRGGSRVDPPAAHAHRLREPSRGRSRWRRQHCGSVDSLSGVGTSRGLGRLGLRTGLGLVPIRGTYWAARGRRRSTDDCVGGAWASRLGKASGRGVWAGRLASGRVTSGHGRARHLWCPSRL